MKFLLTTLQREFSSLQNNKGNWLIPLWFLLTGSGIFVISINEQSQINNVALPIILLLSFLATQLASNYFWDIDYDNGIMEILVTSSSKFNNFITSKLITHLLFLCCPLVISACLILYSLAPALSFTALTFSLLAAIPAFSSIALFVASLNCALPNSGLLLVTLGLPLNIPALLLSYCIITNASAKLPFAPQLALLCAFSLAALTFLPLAIRSALKVKLCY